MRKGNEEPTFSQQKIAYWVALVIDQYYGEIMKETPLDVRARILRAVSKYLITKGITEQIIPDRNSLVGTARLTWHFLVEWPPRRCTLGQQNNSSYKMSGHITNTNLAPARAND